MARARAHSDRFVAFAALATCLWVAALLHGFFFAHAGQIGGDDGYTMALGDRLLAGHFLPYVDGCSHRGPVLYWAAAIAQAAGGRLGWAGSRWLSAVTTVASLLGVFGVGVAARRPFAGAMGAVFFTWSVLVVSAPSPAYIVTGEGVASPLAVLALLFATVALERARTRRARDGFLAGAGAAAALSGLAKQTALPILVPLALYAVASDWVATRNAASTAAPDGLSSDAPSEARSERPNSGGAPGDSGARLPVRSVLALGTGALAVFGVVLLPYAVRGELGTFVYWYYTYNAHVYMLPYAGRSLLRAFSGFAGHDQPWTVGAFVFLVSVTIARTAASLRARTPRGEAPDDAVALEATAAAIAGVCFVAAVSPMRFWPHYFLCVYPFVAILVGLHADRALRAAGESRTPAALVALFLPLAFLVMAASDRLSTLRAEADRGQWKEKASEPICRTIASYAGRSAPLFVWGFAGELYLTCHLPPASRFTYSTLVAGIVPPDWTVVREDRVARGARDGLVADLMQSDPPVVLDAPDTMGHVSMTEVPVVSEFLRSRYCPKGSMPTRHGGNVKIWVRKNLGECEAP